MDWSDVGHLGLSVTGSAILLGAILLALRCVRFDLARIPRRVRPPLAACFVTISTTLLLVVLSLRAPSGAAASPVPTQDAAEAGDAAVATSFRTIRVYEFENWGEDARRKRIGQQLFTMILRALRDEGLNVKRGREKDLPVGLYESQGALPTGLIAHYSKLAPFVCVSGYVSSRKDGRFELEVSVSDIDRTARSTTLRRATFTFSESAESVHQTATRVVGEVLSLARPG